MKHRLADLHSLQEWSRERTTVGHAKTESTQLNDAHVEAHNNDWQVIWAILEPELNKTGLV